MRDTYQSEASILHDLRAVIPRRLQAQVCRERTGERRGTFLSHLVGRAASILVQSAERPPVKVYIHMSFLATSLPLRHHRRHKKAVRVPQPLRPIHERLTWTASQPPLPPQQSLGWKSLSPIYIMDSNIPSKF